MDIEELCVMFGNKALKIVGWIRIERNLVVVITFTFGPVNRRVEERKNALQLCHIHEFPSTGSTGDKKKCHWENIDRFV